MNSYIEKLLQRYSKAGILLDTNILLLYFVGTFDKNEILKFKRTKTFAIEDYFTLIAFLSHFEKVITTPNIITEVSNLSSQIGEHFRTDYFKQFACGIMLLNEFYLPSHDIARMEEFKRFGITDTGILCLAKTNYLVLTDDFKLSQYMQTKGIDALNFNHIRPINWN